MKKNFLLIAIVFIIAFNISLFNTYQNITTSLVVLGISLPWLYLLFKRFTADNKASEEKIVEPKIGTESETSAPTFAEIMFKDKIDLILIILILVSFSLSYFYREHEFHMLIVCAVFAVIKLIRDKKLKK